MDNQQLNTLTIKSTPFIVGVAVFTTLMTAGSIFAIFYLMIDVLALPTMFAPIAIKVLLFLSLAPLPFIAGGLWGAGIGWLMQQPIRPLAKKMALTWGGSFLVVTILLDFTQIPIFAVVDYLQFIPHVIHYLFTLVFIPAFGIVTMRNTTKLLQSLRLDEISRATGRHAGLVAALIFLITSLILLFGLKWEVAGPFAGRRYSMITIMHVCNFSSALAGGAVLGWALEKGRVSKKEGVVE